MKAYRQYLCMCLLPLIILQASQLRAQTRSDTNHGKPGKQDIAKIQSRTLLAPGEISINAKGAVLMDATTGEILLNYNMDKKIPPASFAKLVTLYVLFDLIKHHKVSFNDEVFISKKAWRTAGSKMFIEVNSKVPVEELIKGISVVSGNDACVAIAEYLYGDTETFVNVMNKYVQSLGMENSHFVNPHGLPHDGQFTTAHDMALLARSYVNSFPEALKFHAMQEYTYSGIRQDNRNGLLRKDPSVDGLKTGWVEEAGYHLLATARRDNQRLIAVVMGAESPAAREREALKLLQYGYQNFVLLTLFPADQVVTDLPVWKGKRNALPVVVQRSSAMVIPRGYEKQVRKESILPTDVIAPIEKGQVLGEFVVHINADTVKTVPLVAGMSIDRAGLVKSLSHQIYLFGRSHQMRLVIIMGSMVSLGVVAMFVFFGRRRRRRTGFRF